jgi:hypothetical protein
MRNGEVEIAVSVSHEAEEISRVGLAGPLRQHLLARHLRFVTATRGPCGAGAPDGPRNVDCGGVGAGRRRHGTPIIWLSNMTTRCDELRTEKTKTLYPTIANTSLDKIRDKCTLYNRQRTIAHKLSSDHLLTARWIRPLLFKQIPEFIL